MEFHKCAFSAPLIAGTFGCRQAEAVTRRGGPDIACRSAAASGRCEAVHERVKTATLASLGLEDDLTTVPHSTLVKIQYGTLLGLQRLGGAATDSIPDIDAALEQALARYGSVASVPAPELLPDITEYKLKRRR